MTDDVEDVETVEIRVEHAETALRELQSIIDYTGGEECGVDEACSPLALAKKRIREDLDWDDADKHDLYVQIVDIIDSVGDEREMETTMADPLAESNFTALHHFEQVLDDHYAELEASA